MTIRLTCDVNDTTALFRDILTNTREGHRVLFLTEAGMGGAVIQRVRVKLSRVRVAQRNAGKKRRYFQLKSTIHPHTENGKRHDAVVVWENRTERHGIAETLEDLLGHGDSI